MYNAASYDAQQGSRRRFRHAARARHPRGGRQLWLRHHQAGRGALGGRAAMDRRHALSGVASAGTSTPGGREVGRIGDRTPAPVLPDHQGRHRAARGAENAVARGRSHAARHLVQGGHRMIEEQISQWREYLRRRAAIRGADVEELEDHLRSQVLTLTGHGLAEDEAFLIAVKRMGNLDALSREFAREHSDRLWKQLVMAPDAGEAGKSLGAETLV